MAKFIGNCNHVMNWSELMKILESTPPRNRGTEQDDDIHIDNPKVESLIKVWERAGYVSSPSVRWIDYLPGEHFPEEYVTKFGEWLNVEPAGCWISAVSPGHLVAWHPDYKMPEQEAELLSKGKPRHYTCHICVPSFGQVFIVDKDVFYNEVQGNTYQWDDWQDWHGGLNMGTKTKYLFNFFGWPKDEI